MFEISWSELLILGVVTLIFVGPKEIPALMRTLGRYAGMVRRQANEFKAQFADAMRDMELDEMRKEMEAMQASVNAEVMAASQSLKTDAQSEVRPAHTADGPAAGAGPETGGAQELPPMPAPPAAKQSLKTPSGEES